MIRRSLLVLVLLFAGVVGVGLAQPADGDEAEEIERLVPLVLSERPHDPAAYTQGLLVYEGELYESTGRYGASTIRRVDLQSGEVLQMVGYNEAIFGEGLALVDDERLISITWMNGLAFMLDRESLRLIEFFQYEGEGWGLCYDGAVLYMSDGSASLFTRDPQTFELLDEIPVTLAGEPIDQLNELECVDEVIYANVWKSNDILRIDKESGAVTAVIDASGLLPPGRLEELLAQDAGAVLNGIAYDADNEVFYLTGKLWDTLFEVVFVPAEEAD